MEVVSGEGEGREGHQGWLWYSVDLVVSSARGSLCVFFLKPPALVLLATVLDSARSAPNSAIYSTDTCWHPLQLASLLAWSKSVAARLSNLVFAQAPFEVVGSEVARSKLLGWLSGAP